MKKVGETRFSTFFFDKSYRILKSQWKTKSSEIVIQEQYMKNILYWLELIKEYDPCKFIIHSRDLLYAPSLEIQIWANQMMVQYAEKYKIEITKVAIIPPHNTAEALSAMEQLVGNNPLVNSGNMKYFEDEFEAKQWIYA